MRRRLFPGLNDLDYYGDWQNVSGYGNAWRPRVDAGWAPYQTGYWQNDYPYGLNLGFVRAVGLRALPLWPLGQRRQPVVLGS